MDELTNRQVKVLRTVIEEYMEAAQPVGSQTIEKKHDLGVSPATIRNEMVKLTEAGYLKQPHASAGRVPTKAAFRLYVDRLMEEKKLSVADEVAAKEKVWDARFDFDKLMRETTLALARRTNALALAATKAGGVYHAGYAQILELPEFYDIDITRTILGLLDEAEKIQALFGRAFGEGPIHILLGDELGYDYLDPCGMIFTEFEADPEHSGYLGVIGPSRFNYPTVIPTVRYFGRLVEELASNL